MRVRAEAVCGPNPYPYDVANKSLIWVLRVLVAVLPFVGASVDALVASNSVAVQNTTVGLAWSLWAICIFSVFFLHPITLTLLRLVSPVIATVLILVATKNVAQTAEVFCAAIGVAILLLSFNADIGNEFVQASAYGDEKRFLLRPPVALVTPVVIASTILIIVTICAPLLLAAKNLPIGLACTATSALSIWFLARRIHQLSRRWFVFVPAGFVVHDETLLGTNLMIRKQDLINLQFAERNSQAADLTAVTWGVPLELSFKQPQDVSLTSLSAKHLKSLSAIHASSVLIAPSRPGAVLRTLKNSQTNSARATEAKN